MYFKTTSNEQLLVDLSTTCNNYIHSITGIKKNKSNNNPIHTDILELKLVCNEVATSTEAHT